MEKASNPFEPGAGTRPPNLVGREREIEDALASIARGKANRPIRGQIFYGIRGVGKTVLLRHIGRLATETGCVVAHLETPEGKSFPKLLVPELRKTVLELSLAAKAKAKLTRAVGALQAFASIFKIKVGDVGVEVGTPKGLADSGDLEADLGDLLVSVGELASAAERGVVIALDEMQYLAIDDLSAVVSAVHRCNQEGLPIGFFGAGLPNLLAKAGDAKSYSERLFQFVEVGPLSNEDAGRAIQMPIEAAGAKIAKNALAFIVKQTRGYPYFLQEWGFGAWNAASKSPISLSEVEAANNGIIDRLDRSFFKVRYDRLTGTEKLYLRAMAELGPGPHASGDVANMLGRDVKALGSIRRRVIEKGMAYDTEYGVVAFTVPLFDDFMKREVPDFKPGSVPEARPGPAKRRRKSPSRS